MTYHEYFYWCIYRDANVARVSVTDGNGREFFQIVPVDGRGYRARRDRAIEACMGAIEDGCDPGMVVER